MLTVKLMAQKMAEVVRSYGMRFWMVFREMWSRRNGLRENIASVIKLIVRINAPKEELAAKIELVGRADDLDRGAIEKTVSDC